MSQPSYDEARLRAVRRDSIGVLLFRAERGVLTGAEAALLREYVEAEMHDADTAHARLAAALGGTDQPTTGE
ncbi:hypothetical protein OZK63_21190 [Streptomyces sp. UMAF16]|nr:hypothetical protein [Streptomyces sp. UMAF16]